MPHTSRFFIFLFVGICLVNHTLYPISFQNALTQNKKFKNIQSSEWRLLEQLYNTFILKGIAYSKTPRIPKIIHHIWLGSPLPENCIKLRNTWIKKHPKWQHILWTENEIEALGLQNKSLYDKIKNYGAKSDIARYEILYRYGGLYVDTDFECLQPFDELHHTVDFYTGAGHEALVTLYNGLIASAPGHPILKKCIETLPKNPPSVLNAETIMHTTGPFHFQNSFFSIVRQLSNESPIAVLPTNFFYPWPHYHRKDPNPAAWIRPESLAIHYWHVSWMQ